MLCGVGEWQEWKYTNQLGGQCQLRDDGGSRGDGKNDILEIELM